MLKVLANWMFLVSGVFLISLLTFTGLCFGYTIPGADYQWIPVLSLGSGILQV